MSLSRLESLKQFVLFAGPQHWSQLPTEITSKPSLNSFTKAYKKNLGYSDNTNNNSNVNANSNSNNIANSTNGIQVLNRGRNNYGRLTNWTGDRMVRWGNNNNN